MNRRQMLARAADALAAWNRGDTDAIVANVAEDVIWRDVALGMPLHGRDALLDAARRYMKAFPDMRIEETSSTLAVPRLAQELTISGTHRGEFLGIPPTGRWTENYAAVITQIALVNLVFSIDSIVTAVGNLRGPPGCRDVVGGDRVLDRADHRQPGQQHRDAGRDDQ